MRFPKPWLVALLAIVVSGNAAHAQVEADDLSGRLDLSIPESPAFTILGLSPENVVRPTSGKDVAVAFLNGLDAKGNLQSGIAVDAKPFMIAAGRNLTLADYRTKKGKRYLANIRLSFATASGDSDEDKADRVSVGVRWSPWNKGDPRLDQTLDKCYETALTAFSDATTVQGDTENAGKDDPALKEAAKKCVTEAEKRNWNASMWEIGLAGFNINAKGLKEGGAAAWTSLSLRAGKTGQFIANVRANDNQLVADETAMSGYSLKDSWTAGARFRWGGAHGALLLEGSYVREDPQMGQKDEFSRALIGTEFRVAKGLWLQVAVGDTFGSDAMNDDTVYSGQIRWGHSKDRKFQ